MGVGYRLINYTRKEWISFAHVPASTARELAGNPVSAAIVTWYLLHHQNDHVAFVSDTYGEWPFPGENDFSQSLYRDVTDELVAALIAAEILTDEGNEYLFKDDPDVYIRKLRNVW